MIPRERRVSFRAGSTLPAPESRALERPAPAVLRSSRFKSKTRPISVRSLKKKHHPYPCVPVQKRKGKEKKGMALDRNQHRHTTPDERPHTPTTSPTARPRLEATPQPQDDRINTSRSAAGCTANKQGFKWIHVLFFFGSNEQRD